jgi:hypothetical protein
MTKRYSIIGDIIADRYDDTLSPGGAGAIAIAISALGGTVKLRSVIGTDEPGKSVLAQLKKARIHPGLIDKLDDVTTPLVDRDDTGQVINRTPGTGIQKGAVMDVYDLFGHDAMVLDTRDQPLRRFISDLPAHTDGNVRMISTLSHLDWQDPTADELEIAMRCDAIVGTPVQYEALTGQAEPTHAIGDIYDQMPGTQLRAAVLITPGGIDLVAREDRILRPVQDAVPDLLLPQVVAGVAWGLANRAPWEVTATVAIDPSQAGS